MSVVTIQGQIGSLSRYIGQEAAKLLKADYVDYEILAQAAHRLGATIEAVAKKDERPSRLRERVAHGFQVFLERSGAAGSAGDPLLGPTGMELLMARSISDLTAQPISKAQELRDTRFLSALETVVKDVAETGNAVIMGRASNVMLRDMPKAVHVYVVASQETRVRNRMRVDGTDRETTEKALKETEDQRQAFFRKFFKVDPNNPLLYDLVVNVDKLSIEAAAKLVADAAHDIEGAKRVAA